MQSPKLQEWRRMRDHLHTPKIFDIFVDPSSFIPGRLLSSRARFRFCLTMQRWKKYIFRDPMMPKKTHKKLCREATPILEKNHIKKSFKSLAIVRYN